MKHKTQPVTAKYGEVNFRKRLTQQHLGSHTHFDQEYSFKEMKESIQQKIARARADISSLDKRDITLSPYLEIGSGYGQAALLLTNEFKAHGYALDIALDPLASITKTAKLFGYKKIPHLIIGDAENLPFPDNSIPFIFCYQTLHHFPHPKKVVEEAYRVLTPNGTFFFAEEPIKQEFNLPFWNRPTRLRWWEKILKVLLILPFISRIGKTEIDHGILEEAFSVKTWREALEIFPNVEAFLFPFPLGPIANLHKARGLWKSPAFVNYINAIFLFFAGGGITARAWKNGKVSRKSRAKSPLLCPNCQRTKKNNFITKQTNYWTCPHCKTRYLSRKKALLLLESKLAKKLYP